SDSPARLPGEILGRPLEDLPLGGELGRLGPQRRVLGLQSVDLLLRRLTFGRRGVLLRRPGLQWAGGQRPVSSGLLAGPVDLEPTPQRATHDAEVLGDAADRGARGGLVQVDGLTTELLGIVLPSHDSRIISLPQHHVLDSACPRTGVRPQISMRWVWDRCQRIDSAPASRPCELSWARIVAISCARAGLVAFGFDTGRRERGWKAASPSAR